MTFVIKAAPAKPVVKPLVIRQPFVPPSQVYKRKFNELDVLLCLTLALTIHNSEHAVLDAVEELNSSTSPAIRQNILEVVRSSPAPAEVVDRWLESHFS